MNKQLSKRYLIKRLMTLRNRITGRQNFLFISSMIKEIERHEGVLEKMDTTKSKLLLEKLQSIKEAWSSSLSLLFEALKSEDILLYLTHPLKQYIHSAPEKDAARAQEIADNISNLESATKLEKIKDFWKYFLSFWIRSAPEAFRFDIIFRALRQAALHLKSYGGDIIRLKSGDKIKCTILSIDKEKTEIELLDGKKQSIPTEDVKAFPKTTPALKLSKGGWIWTKGVGPVAGMISKVKSMVAIDKPEDLIKVEKQKSFYNALLNIPKMKQLIPAALLYSSKKAVSTKEKLASKAARILIERLIAI